MMFAIFWRGLGLLVPLIAMVVGATIELITRALFNNTYYQEHGWPILVAMSLSGVLCWQLANVLDWRDQQAVGTITPLQQVGSRKRHEFFFISVRAWGPILFFVGVAFFLAHLLGFTEST